MSAATTTPAQFFIGLAAWIASRSQRLQPRRGIGEDVRNIIDEI